MDISLYSNDRIRVLSGSSGGFIDLGGSPFDVAVFADFNIALHYIQIRKKEHEVRVYSFAKKEYADDFDFGWFEDGEVIFEQGPRIFNLQ